MRDVAEKTGGDARRAPSSRQGEGASQVRHPAGAASQGKGASQVRHPAGLQARAKVPVRCGGQACAGASRKDELCCSVALTRRMQHAARAPPEPPRPPGAPSCCRVATHACRGRQPLLCCCCGRAPSSKRRPPLLPLLQSMGDAKQGGADGTSSAAAAAEDPRVNASWASLEEPEAAHKQAQAPASHEVSSNCLPRGSDPRDPEGAVYIRSLHTKHAGVRPAPRPATASAKACSVWGLLNPRCRPPLRQQLAATHTPSLVRCCRPRSPHPTRCLFAPHL